MRVKLPMNVCTCSGIIQDEGLTRLQQWIKV